VIGYIPSPPVNGVDLGPLELHFYGLLIAVGVLAAVWVAQRRWEAIGGFRGSLVPIAFWAVVAALIGARLYSVATSWQQDTGGDPLRIFAIWEGGLGIWGGVAGGVLGGWLKARQMHLPLAPLLDVVAPTLALGQAVGRWGNYFNQELFGLPSKLPWAVRITDQNELSNIFPLKYRTPLVDGTYVPGTFQPTFLYEFIWDLTTLGLLLLIERKVKLRRGYLFAAYAALYTFGRFFVEYIRIDPAHRYLGLRLNDWSSVVVFVAASALLLWRGRPRAEGGTLAGGTLAGGTLAGGTLAGGTLAPEQLVGAKLPAAVAELEQERAAARERAHRQDSPPVTPPDGSTGDSSDDRGDVRDPPTYQTVPGSEHG
jgi:phosphatidylglycerol---prolipoprotein diacylglyceryl transferase